MPALTVSSPGSGDTVVGPTLSVTGTAGASYGIAGVYADLDGGGYNKVNGTGQWAVNYTNMTSGNHTVKVFSKGISGLVSSTNSVSVFLTNYAFNYTNSWTIMVFLDAVNNLEGYSFADFNEMESGLLKAMNNGSRDIMSNLNIIVLYGRKGTYYYPTEMGGSSWSGTRLYRVLPDSDPVYFGSERLDDDNVAIKNHVLHASIPSDMGNTNTLKWLIEYTTNHYPAQNYGLVFWDHGVGVQSICTDETYSSSLYLDQIRWSINSYFNGAKKLNLLGFDACYMATAENALEFKNVANYMVGSMYTEDQYGWDYDYLFGHLYGARDVKSITDRDLSRLAVEGYREYHESHFNNWGDTLSAADLSFAAALKTSIDLLGVAIYAESKENGIETVRDSSINFYNNNDTLSVDVPYYDLYDLCNRIVNDSYYSFSPYLKTAAANVITSLGNAVVYAYGGTGNFQQYYYGDGTTVKRGLSLFFSRGNKTFTANASHPLKGGSGAPQSHFWFQWWYTSTNVNTWWPGGHYYGNLDFCDSDATGTVTHWRDLMKAWYDPATNTNTPGSY